MLWIMRGVRSCRISCRIEVDCVNCIRADSDVRSYFIDSIYRYPIPVDSNTITWANALAAAKLDPDLLPVARAARQMMEKCHSKTNMPWPLRKPPEQFLRPVE
jgi:hypothetical protein